MTETKFTPGPLRVQQTDDWPFLIEIIDANGKAVSSEVPACHCSSDRTAEDALRAVNFSPDERKLARETNERQLADAHLRAAAPDLFSALMSMVWQFDNPLARRFIGNDDAQEARADARAALARARGESQ